MAWEVFHKFDTAPAATLNFDFTKYRYRVTGEHVNGSAYNILGLNGTGSNYRIVNNIRTALYQDLYEGMKSPIGTALVSGQNVVYAFYNKNTYLITVIERELMNVEPGQPGPFTKPLASETLRVGQTYRFEWGPSFDPDPGDTVYYMVYRRLNGTGGYAGVTATSEPYWDYTIPEGTTSLSLIIYPLDDYTDDWSLNVPRYSPEYLVSSGFALHPKIGGAVRETDKAWVKVDGQLREVDKVWTKVNNALREV